MGYEIIIKSQWKKIENLIITNQILKVEREKTIKFKNELKKSLE